MAKKKEEEKHCKCEKQENVQEKIDDAHLEDDLQEKCEEGCSCGGECHCQENEDKTQEYLNMLQRLQADFENYRKHVSDDIARARDDGAESVIEAFLPSLDTFKEAKKNINDEKVLQGINMIENKILEALSKLKVEKIEAVGQKFDPHKHNVIAAACDNTKEDGVILDEFQAGWMKGDKVIRYSTVLVNKLNS